ncbi:MAG: DUF4430 domain-containing protein [Candidatus Jorgensenbacteria bacterium]
MASKKLRNSLIVVGVLALVLVGLSFFVSVPQLTDVPVGTNESIAHASFEIDFGDGQTETISFEADGTKNIFQVMEEALPAAGIHFDYETYAGLGKLIDQIGEKKNGENGNYWQFWVNGSYSTVGVSSYFVKAGDRIEWEFTNEIEE